MTTAVGVIGLGLVGTALARRLLNAGYAVQGHDVQSQARQGFSAIGGVWHDDVRGLQDCDVLVLAVFQTTDVEQVMQVLFLDSAAAVRPRKLVIDCSTGEPERLEKLAPKLAACGIDFIEAPLSGSSQQINSGEATLLLGGAQNVIEQHQNLLRALSPTCIVAGGVGMGARAKLATNLVLGLNRVVLAEGMVFAQKLGIEPAAFLQMVLNTPAKSDAALVKGERMVNQNFTPESRIRQHLKDVDVMLAEAQKRGQRLPLSEQHAALMRAAVAAGDGELDNAAIIKQIERENNKGF